MPITAAHTQHACRRRNTGILGIAVSLCAPKTINQPKMNMKNKQLIICLIILLTLCGCGVQNVKFFSSIQSADDETYGYTASNPILIKNADLGKSINASYYYMSRLRSSNGNNLELIDRFSVGNPNYDDPKIPVNNRYTGQPLNKGGAPLLDCWVLLSDKDTITLYTNPYKKGVVQVPNGMTFSQDSESNDTYEANPPNYLQIKTNIRNEKSEYYYPDLLSRYKLNDFTLTQEDYVHLYFGYSFTEGFNPDLNCSCQEILLSYYQKEELNNSDCDSIIKYASICINENPFDIRQLNMLGYAYHLKGEESKAEEWAIKTQNIIGTILSTGTGQTKKDAIYVISVSHEYEILKAIGFFSTGQSLIDMKYDYINLKKNPARIKGMYFNIERIFDARMKK